GTRGDAEALQAPDYEAVEEVDVPRFRRVVLVDRGRPVGRREGTTTRGHRAVELAVRVECRRNGWIGRAVVHDRLQLLHVREPPIRVAREALVAVRLRAVQLREERPERVRPGERRVSVV